jgi:hypothetical protein
MLALDEISPASHPGTTADDFLDVEIVRNTIRVGKAPPV